MRTAYVCGFAFLPQTMWSLHTYRVLLIVKRRGPANMAGKLNGIGGKIEIGEGFRSAMVREFKEECNVDTTIDDWSTFHTERYNSQHHGDGTGAIVYYMTTQLSQQQALQAATITDEKIIVATEHIMSLRKRMVNLNYLVPMAWTHLNHPDVRPV